MKHTADEIYNLFNGGPSSSHTRVQLRGEPLVEMAIRGESDLVFYFPERKILKVLFKNGIKNYSDLLKAKKLDGIGKKTIEEMKTHLLHHQDVDNLECPSMFNHTPKPITEELFNRSWRGFIKETTGETVQMPKRFSLTFMIRNFLDEDKLPSQLSEEERESWENTFNTTAFSALSMGIKTNIPYIFPDHEIQRKLDFNNVETEQDLYDFDELQGFTDEDKTKAAQFWARSVLKKKPMPTCFS